MLKIVIIDDSRIIRERLSGMLTEIGTVEVVGTAESAASGIEMIRTIKPDFVILDIRMPGGSGIQALAEIKQLQPALKVAVLTNYPYPAYSKRCYELGADYFFDKSSEFEMVKTTLSLYSSVMDEKAQPAPSQPTSVQSPTETALTYGVSDLSRDVN